MASSCNFFCNTLFLTDTAPRSRSLGPTRNARNSEKSCCNTEENSGRLVACSNRPSSFCFRFITRRNNIDRPKLDKLDWPAPLEPMDWYTWYPKRPKPTTRTVVKPFSGINSASSRSTRYVAGSGTSKIMGSPGQSVITWRIRSYTARVLPDPARP